MSNTMIIAYEGFADVAVGLPMRKLCKKYYVAMEIYKNY
jgi:hypothetical protein